MFVFTVILLFKSIQYFFYLFFTTENRQKLNSVILGVQILRCLDVVRLEMSRSRFQTFEQLSHIPTCSFPSYQLSTNKSTEEDPIFCTKEGPTLTHGSSIDCGYSIHGLKRNPSPQWSFIPPSIELAGNLRAECLNASRH